MSDYTIPELSTPIPLKENQIYLLASGNMRENLNKATWPDQHRHEQALQKLFADEGYQLVRAFDYDSEREHGFITSQRHGMDIFSKVHPKAPLVVAVAAWQCSYHVLPGLRDHQGPILTVSNWSGKWPGLVGLLNLNGSLTKMGVPYSTLWLEDDASPYCLEKLHYWIKNQVVEHDTSHIRPWSSDNSSPEQELGRSLADQLLHNKAIMGVFDEGCMGMYNAIIEDDLLNGIGIYKERLSQAALAAAMYRIPDQEALAVRRWLEAQGFRFLTGDNPEEDLTDQQILDQCKMYLAVVNMADRYHCDTVGIQYQDGMKDLAPASDLVEGLLNNPHRPPVYHPITKEELYPGQALPHFNEADEGAGIDLLINNRVWCAMGMDPSSTLHDVRWGEHFSGNDIDNFVWVFMISGAVPASHIEGGYANAVSERQPPKAFPAGGGSLKGVCKPGEFVWSRVYIQNGSLHADVGRGTAVSLPMAEVNRRWEMTTPMWPILNAVLHGVSQNQFMGRHKANHITVTYAPSADLADKALTVKSAMMDRLGIQIHFCGV